MVKISELIEKLQKIQKEYGDIDFICPEFDSWGGYDIGIPEQINLHKAVIKDKYNIYKEDSDVNEVTAFSISTWDASDDDRRILFEYKENETLVDAEPIDYNSDKGILGVWGNNVPKKYIEKQSLTYKSRSDENV